MKSSGIIKQLKSGKYIIELASGLTALKGNVNLILNATTSISSKVFSINGQSVLFLTHRIIKEMGLMSDDNVDIQLIDGRLKSRMPLTVMY